MIQVRAMRADDLPAVLHIQAAAYPVALHERAEVLARKLSLAPHWCRVAELDGQVAAYLFSHPWSGETPPAVHAWLECLPHRPDCWFVHDLAVHPQAQGRGLASQLLDPTRAFACSSGCRHALLVAVAGAAAFWQRLGFAELPSSSALAAYGSDARLMHCAM